MANYTPRTEVKPLNPEYWTPFLQAPLYKSLVALDIANTRLEAYLKDGDTVNHSYIDMPAVVDYTPNTDIDSFALVDATKEQLVVNQVKVAPFYVDRIEELQSNVGIAIELGERAAYKLRDEIDTHVLKETTNGTSWSFGTALTVDNIIKFFSEAGQKLREENVEEIDWIAVVTPAVASLIEQKATSVGGFNLADSAAQNGYAGSWLGFRIYVSNNLPDASDGKYLYIGRRGMIDLVMQAAPQMKISDAEDRLGYKFKPHTVYGSKVFTENAKRFLAADVTISSS